MALRQKFPISALSRSLSEGDWLEFASVNTKQVGVGNRRVFDVVAS